MSRRPRRKSISSPPNPTADHGQPSHPPLQRQNSISNNLKPSHFVVKLTDDLVGSTSRWGAHGRLMPNIVKMHGLIWDFVIQKMNSSLQRSCVKTLKVIKVNESGDCIECIIRNTDDTSRSEPLATVPIAIVGWMMSFWLSYLFDVVFEAANERYKFESGYRLGLIYGETHVFDFSDAAKNMPKIFDTFQTNDSNDLEFHKRSKAAEDYAPDNSCRHDGKFIRRYQMEYSALQEKTRTTPQMIRSEPILQSVSENQDGLANSIIDRRLADIKLSVVHRRLLRSLNLNLPPLNCLEDDFNQKTIAEFREAWDSSRPEFVRKPDWLGTFASSNPSWPASVIALAELKIEDSHCKGFVGFIKICNINDALHEFKDESCKQWTKIRPKQSKRKAWDTECPATTDPGQSSVSSRGKLLDCLMKWSEKFQFIHIISTQDNASSWNFYVEANDRYQQMQRWGMVNLAFDVLGSTLKEYDHLYLKASICYDDNIYHIADKSTPPFERYICHGQNRAARIIYHKSLMRIGGQIATDERSFELIHNDQYTQWETVSETMKGLSSPRTIYIRTFRDSHYLLSLSSIHRTV